MSLRGKQKRSSASLRGISCYTTFSGSSELKRALLQHAVITPLILAPLSP